MYFASRMQAGRMLATQLATKYRYENCAVVAVNDGGIMVGAQIASELHCILMLLLSSEITLPMESDALASITASGALAYNPAYSSGEVEEMVGEYYGLIEQEKLTNMSEMNHESKTALIDRRQLRGRNVIVVSDGFKSGFQLDVVAEYLKTTAIEKLIVATPLASLKAVDRMHVVADELLCLSVVEDFISTEHYYDVNDVPDHETAVKTIEQIVLNWK